MKKTKGRFVRPLGKKILLDIPETSAGGIQVVQGAQIQEQGVIVDMGPEVPKRESIKLTTGTVRTEGFAVGDIVQFKAWSVDIITVDGQKHYYISCDSDALCGIVTG